MTLLSDLCVIVGERTPSRPSFSIAIATGGLGAVPRTRALEECNGSAVP